MSGPVDAAVAESFRQDWGRVVAALISMTGDWDLAEECAQEAFTVALAGWRRDGIPHRPRAWLITTARNRAVDRIRRDQVGAAKLRLIAAEQMDNDSMDLDVLDSGIADDRLRLVFTCCHPALAFDAQVALALRTLCGLTTAELAPGVPRNRGDHGQTSGPHEAEDRCRQDSVPGAARASPARTHHRGAGRDLPAVQ